MTFHEARAAHLDALDNAYRELRRIVSSPDWCNDNFPPFKEAVQSLTSRLAAIGRLNDAEMTA